MVKNIFRDLYSVLLYLRIINIEMKDINPGNIIYVLNELN